MYTEKRRPVADTTGCFVFTKGDTGMIRYFTLIVILLFGIGELFARDDLKQYLSQTAIPLQDGSDLTPLVQAVGDARFVLLGEASHGTAEYYIWRKRISQRLIEEKGFSFIAVEGDWTAAYEVNKYIKNLPGAAEDARSAVSAFTRWPQWMWSNEEVVSLIEWLRKYNLTKMQDDRVGFYGIDIYAMWESIDEVISFFEVYYPEHHSAVRNAYGCILQFEDDPQRYAISVVRGKPHCADEVQSVVNLLRLIDADRTDRTYFNAKQNALVVKYAERHYRAMGDRGTASWNHRVGNFKLTVERLMEFYGNDSRGIVWAHNTHVGDARATPMARQGLENIGKLIREKYGNDDVFIVGFGTYRGTVIAGREWGGPMEFMEVPDGLKGSVEDLFNRVGHDNAVYIFNEETPQTLYSQLRHRAKGVVYNPRNEHGNYVATILPLRYNAFVFMKETTALTPLP
jgi:erythromycin esterase